jgi:hypothetical protein
MTATQRLRLHQLILVGLKHDTTGRGFSAAVLAGHARSELNLELSEDQVLSELRTLADQLIVAPITTVLSGTRWIITEQGRQALAEAGL